MGRPEARKRKLAQAAAGSMSLDRFMKKPSMDKDTEDHSEEDTARIVTVASHSAEMNVITDFDEDSGAKSASVVRENLTSPDQQSLNNGLFVEDTNEPSPCQSTDTLFDDIGDLAQCTSIDNVTDEQKYNLLKHHFQPDDKFVFPATYSSGCNRAFNKDWLEKFPWLVYSRVMDGVYCKFCYLFINHNKRREEPIALVNTPFSKWVKLSEKLGKHSRAQYHNESALKAHNFITTLENINANVSLSLNMAKKIRILENRHIIECSVQAVMYCARQCIALRGNTENLQDKGNPGNFLAFLRVMAQHDDLLNQHLQKPRQKNATYLSPKTQNEIIEIMEKDIIQDNIIRDIKQAKFFAIMADEVTSHNEEIMPLVLRFVDNENNIREEFVKFSILPRVTGKHIGQTILDDIESLGLDIKNTRGQGYDGASNMSSSRVGVQAVIKAQSPLAVYTHCSAHNLNLVLSHSSRDVIAARNMIDKLKEVCLYFLDSPKRNNALIDVVSKHVESSGRRKPLIDLCKTRWSARHTAYQHFYQCYSFIVKTLERIGLLQHQGQYSPDFDNCWEGDVRSRAVSLLNGITSFDFIITFLTVYQFLSHLAGITIKLQGETEDIISAYNQIDEVTGIYSALASNITEEFNKVYLQAVRMASEVNVEPGMPRICKRQQHRQNSGDQHTDPETYFRINLAIPFVGHVLNELETRFSDFSKRCTKLLGLVPSVMSRTDDVAGLKDVVEIYKDDLPSPELFDAELFRWKTKWRNSPKEALPVKLSQAIKVCDSSFFPNIYTLLKIACTQTVTTSECERNASVIRRLRNFMRSCMSEERLTSLALLHIHYNHPIDVAQVVDRFASKHPRRLEMESVLLEHRRMLRVRSCA